MNRENLISSYIQNVYEEIQEEAKPDPVPTAGLGSKTITNVPEQEEQPVQQEKAGSILSRFLDGFKDYMRGDDDELQTTKTVRKENAAREANLEGVSILDLSLANPDGAVDGLINIPTKITKPEVMIDDKKLQSKIMETLSTITRDDPLDIDTNDADGGAAIDKKVVGGLMSRPIDPKSFIDSFVDKIGDLESKEDHIDHLGIKTLGYGVLPATAKTYGFDPDSEKYKDRRVLAKDVYQKMYNEADKKYPDVFKGLTDTKKINVFSMYINTGSLPNGLVTALSKDTPDFDAAKDSLASVVLGSPRNDDNTRKKDKDGKIIYTSSKGLSKRRAQEYNGLMMGDKDFKPVKTISVGGTREKPSFIWKDADGNEIHKYTPSVSGNDKVYQGLDKSNSMDDIEI
tara:strand:- start:3073 stop:4272 length:1200 start_codon:yes stop_codon:yes gene_type:complete